MSDPLDEPRLTAYALGELPPEERAVVESLLERDAAARGHVDEVRATAALLTEELAHEHAPRLTELQHAQIERWLEHREHAPPAATVVRIGPRNWQFWGSLAASVVIVATAMAAILPQIYQYGGGKGGHGTGGGGEPGGPDRGRPGGPTVAPAFVGSPPHWFPRDDDSQTRFVAREPAFFGAGLPPMPGSGLAPQPGGERRFVRVRDYPLSAIAIGAVSPADADRGSLGAVRRALAANRPPRRDEVRTDELLNSFSYADAPPTDGAPVAAGIEVAACPWNPKHRLVRVALVASTGTEVPAPASRPAEVSTTAPFATAPSTTPTAFAMKDVRIQVEFNPSLADAYRLIGYESASLSSDDPSPVPVSHLKAGQSVTALYEVVPAGTPSTQPVASAPMVPLRFQKPVLTPTGSDELLAVLVAGRNAAGEAHVAEFAARDAGKTFAAASPDFRFAAAVAAFGMLLRDSEHRGLATHDWLETTAAASGHADREAFIDLVRRARQARP